MATKTATPDPDLAVALLPGKVPDRRKGAGGRGRTSKIPRLIQYFLDGLSTLEPGEGVQITGHEGSLYKGDPTGVAANFRDHIKRMEVGDKVKCVVRYGESGDAAWLVRAEDVEKKSA